MKKVRTSSQGPVLIVVLAALGGRSGMHDDGVESMREKDARRARLEVVHVRAIQAIEQHGENDTPARPLFGGVARER